MPYPSPLTRPAPTLYPSPVTSFTTTPPPSTGTTQPTTVAGPTLADELANRRAGPLEVPHLAWPLRLTGTDFAMVEQDSLEEIRQSILIAMHTPKGVRPLSPEVGLDDPTFTDRVDPDELAADLAAQEPRAALRITANDVDDTGRQLVQITVGLSRLDDEEA